MGKYGKKVVVSDQLNDFMVGVMAPSGFGKTTLMYETCDLLVINKIDTVKKEEILTFIDTYRKELDFAEIVPVAINAVERLLSGLLSTANAVEPSGCRKRSLQSFWYGVRSIFK